MQETVYSIVIPHKNIPKLLERCLASIPLRDDLEVIIVDDNSDPNIVDFEHFPGQDRSNTTVIFDKSGKGAGRARNIGLQHAQGKWLVFADADDFFNYCLNEALDEYKNFDEADIVFFSVSSIDSNNYTNDPRGNEHVRLIDKYFRDGDETFFRYHRGSPCSKMVKRSLVEKYHVVFSETLIHNDTRFSYISGHYAKSIHVDRRAIYCITFRPSSITYTMTDEKVIDRAKVMAEKELFLQEHNLPSANLGWCIEDMVRLENEGKVWAFDTCMGIFSQNGISRDRVLKLMANYKRKENLSYYSKKIHQMIQLLANFAERSIIRIVMIWV